MDPESAVLAIMIQGVLRNPVEAWCEYLSGALVALASWGSFDSVAAALRAAATALRMTLLLIWQSEIG